MHRYVLWPRIDQKTCLKAIVSANLEAVPLENVLEGDELHTDMVAMRQQVDRLGPNSIVCIVTTTSCFAPRAADSVVEVAKLCKSSGFGHIINNAYGVQSAALCSLVRELRVPAISANINLLRSTMQGRHQARGTCLLGTAYWSTYCFPLVLCQLWVVTQVTAAWRKGRVDAVVQSTDKNFMVPVGGAVIAASKQDTSLVDAVNKV